MLLQDICVGNIPFMYDLADTYNASALRRACTLFVLEHYTKLSSELWYATKKQKRSLLHYKVWKFDFTFILIYAGFPCLLGKLYQKSGVTSLIFSHGQSKLAQPSYKTFNFDSFFRLDNQVCSLVQLCAQLIISEALKVRFFLFNLYCL